MPNAQDFCEAETMERPPSQGGLAWSGWLMPGHRFFPFGWLWQTIDSRSKGWSTCLGKGTCNAFILRSTNLSWRWERALSTWPVWKGKNDSAMPVFKLQGTQSCAFQADFVNLFVMGAPEFVSHHYTLSLHFRRSLPRTISVCLLWCIFVKCIIGFTIYNHLQT